MAKKETIKQFIEIDVIIPCHNAEETIQETVESAMVQVLPDRLSSLLQDYSLSIHVCCYDDGSMDSSWALLCRLEELYQKHTNNSPQEETETTKSSDTVIPSRLWIEQGPTKGGRGAGYARNRAAELSQRGRRRQTTTDHHHQSSSLLLRENNNSVDVDVEVEEQFLCLLDSDDIMHKYRVAEQVHGMMSLSKEQRKRTLLGCKVKRDPPDSTWHYTQWANGLSHDRLGLERFREVTVLQPTWMLCRSRFELLGGYIEAPPPLKKTSIIANNNVKTDSTCTASCVVVDNKDGITILKLVHPTFDNPQTLRLAEDLRFFHSHLYANGTLKLHLPSHDPDTALVTYRHRHNVSQSYQTSRKLLLNLRALALEACVLQNNGNNTRNSSNVTVTPWIHHNGRFVVWGAGRDGKDFVKALSEEARKRVYCFVDVDFKKIQQGFYTHKDMNIHIPIVHFSLLSKDPEQRHRLLLQEECCAFGRIDKSKASSSIHQEGQQSRSKKPKTMPESVVAAAAAAAAAATPKVVKAIDLKLLPELPVVVCVAMYRTNGALERNVQAVGRTEGKDLWHFS